MTVLIPNKSGESIRLWVLAPAFCLNSGGGEQIRLAFCFVFAHREFYRQRARAARGPWQVQSDQNQLRLTKR